MTKKLQTAFPHITQKSKKIIRTQQRFTLKDSHLIELKDSKNKIWQLDSADRLNALKFNRYKEWECSAG